MANPTVQLNVPIVAIDSFSEALKKAQTGLEGFYRLGKGDLSNLTEQLQVMSKAVTTLAQAFAGSGGLIAGVTAFGLAAAAGAAAVVGVTVAVSRWAQSAAGLERLSAATGIAYGRLKAFQEASSAAEFAPGLQAIELAVGHLQKLKLRNVEERRALVQLIPEDYGSIEKLAAAGKFTEAIEYIIRLSERLDPQTVGLLTQHFFGTADTQLIRDVWELSKQYEKQFELTKQQKATVMEIEKTLAQIIIEWQVLLDSLAKWVAPEILNLLKHVKDLIDAFNNPPKPTEPADPAREAMIQDQIRYWSGHAGISMWGVPWLGAAGIDALIGTNLRGAVFKGYVDYMQWMINNVWRKGFGSFVGSAGAATMPGGAFGAGAGGAFSGGAGVSTYSSGMGTGTGTGTSGATTDGSTAGGGPTRVGAGDPSATVPGATDVSGQAGFGFKFGKFEDQVKGMIIHHTAGRGDIGGVMSTFRQRNFPTQFVIDRQGRIWQTLPEGARGQHMRAGQGVGRGLGNQNMEGVEIIANDDDDVLPVQIEAAKRLVAARAKRFGYDPKTSVFGHGEVNPHKQRTEGMSTVQRIRRGELDDEQKLNPTARATGKSSSLVPRVGGTKIAVNLNVVGPAGTRAIANMKSDDDLFDADTIRRAILA